jgi:colicin import membrane protein
VPPKQLPPPATDPKSPPAISGDKQKPVGDRPRTASAATNQRHANRCTDAGKTVSVGGWYVVKAGDTLSSIAKRHYGNGDRYTTILRANSRKISDPNLIFPCQRLYISGRRHHHH